MTGLTSAGRGAHEAAAHAGRIAAAAEAEAALALRSIVASERDRTAAVRW